VVGDQRKRSAIFFDRDGIVNKVVLVNGRPFPPRNLGELEYLNGIHDLIEKAKTLNYLTFVVTNQPDIARRKTESGVIEEIHEAIQHKLKFNEIRVCPHDDIDQCSCRKPLPGMLLALALKYNVDLEQSFMIGDRWKDIEAGHRASCRTVWLKNTYNEEWLGVKPDYSVEDLNECLNIINRF